MRDTFKFPYLPLYRMVYYNKLSISFDYYYLFYEASFAVRIILTVSISGVQLTFSGPTTFNFKVCSPSVNSATSTDNLKSIL